MELVTAKSGGIWIIQRSNLFEGRLTGFYGFVQVLLGVGQREEPGFELGGWKIDPLLHHLDKELGKSLRIARFGRLIISHRPFRKKEREQPRRSVDGDGDTLLLSTS